MTFREVTHNVVVGSSTPWGVADHAVRIAEGIVKVQTASHGGFWLSPERNRQVPEGAREESGWYEEDVEWVIPATVFREEYADYLRSQKGHTEESLQEEFKTIDQTLRDWLPKAWEAIHGKKLAVEDSRELRRQRFYEKHREAPLVTAAWGDWSEVVPSGWVMVSTMFGGVTREFGGVAHDSGTYLLRDEEYERLRQESEFDPVLDPVKAVPWGCSGEQWLRRAAELLALDESAAAREELAWVLGAPVDGGEAGFERARREAVARVLSGTLLEDAGLDAWVVAREASDAVTVIWPREGEYAGLPHIMRASDYEELRQQRQAVLEEPEIEIDMGMAP